MSHLRLKGLRNIGFPQISETIRDNTIFFLDYTLLEAGNFFNISIPTSGGYGGDRSRLRPISDPNYTDGQVWGAYRGNWCWESGLSTASQPINISGVFVDSTFYPKASGDFYVNYPEGKVVFSTPVSGIVRIEYSHKWVNILSSRDIPFLQEGHTRSFRIDDSNFLAGSGIWNQLQTKVELPVVAVEVLDGRSYEGYQLGKSSLVYTDIVFHIISEDDYMAYRLADILGNQFQKSIFLFDTQRMANQDAFPLTYNGSKNSNPLTYPDLVKPTGDGGFRYTSDVFQGKLTILETSARYYDKISPRLYHSSARWRTEVVLNDL